MRDQQQQQVDELAKLVRWPQVDEWPVQATNHGNNEKFSKQHEEDERMEGLTEVRKWRLQVLLASHKFGIPSLALTSTYRSMFNQELRFEQWGFDGLADFIGSLGHLISVQEPDAQTALLFPNYKHDRILHDARYGHTFTTCHSSNAATSPNGNIQNQGRTSIKPDADLLISRAWLNRDEELPDDVVLAGEQYPELVLPMSLAKLDERSVGLFQAMIVSAADPHHLYIHVKNSALEMLDSLSDQADRFFKQESRFPVEMYSVPSEFIYPGFPCLAFNRRLGTFERAAIKKRSSRDGCQRMLVESVDFGGELLVQSIDLFLLPRQFFKFPRQALRVSLAGLKPPAGADKWTVSAGRRLRCFSNRHYWLECLLLPSPPPASTNPQASTDSLLTSSSSSSSSSSLSTSSSSANLPLDAAQPPQENPIKQPGKPKRHQRHQPPIQFEMILCDRNDDELDLFLDEVLVMETYSASDQSRSQHLANLKEQLKTAMASVARPKNPFLD